MAGRAWKSSAVHVAVSLALFAILEFLVAEARDLEAFAPILWSEAFEAMVVPSPSDGTAAPAPAVGLMVINMKSTGLVVSVLTLIVAGLAFLVAFGNFPVTLLTYRRGRTHDTIPETGPTNGSHNRPMQADDIVINIDAALDESSDTNRRDAAAQILPRINGNSENGEENYPPAPAPAPEASDKSEKPAPEATCSCASPCYTCYPMINLASDKSAPAPGVCSSKY